MGGERNQKAYPRSTESRLISDGKVLKVSSIDVKACRVCGRNEERK